MHVIDNGYVPFALSLNIATPLNHLCHVKRNQLSEKQPDNIWRHFRKWPHHVVVYFYKSN